MTTIEEIQKQVMPSNAVLVTGLIRSGTTWVGKVLATARGTLYLHEPLNPGSNWNGAIPVPCHYLHLDDRSGGGYRAPIAHLLHARPHFHGSWKDAARSQCEKYIEDQLGEVRNVGITRDRLRSIFKDPMALYASEWLVKTFAMHPVCVVRHPVRTIKSMLSLEFTRGNLHYAARQPQLLEEFYPGPYREMLARDMASLPQLDLVRTTAIRVKHWLHAVAVLRDRNPDWMFLDYTRLVTDPEAEFREVFNRCGLEPSQQTMDALGQGVSGVRNPDLKDEATLVPIPEDPAVTFAATEECGDWPAIYGEYFTEIADRLSDLVDW